jgi:hypothetical protein
MVPKPGRYSIEILSTGSALPAVVLLVLVYRFGISRACQVEKLRLFGPPLNV